MSFKINPEEILLKFLLMLYWAVVVNQGASANLLYKGDFNKKRQNKH